MSSHAEADQSQDGTRGRQASTPGDIPMRGWLDIAKRIYVSANENNISLLAAGVAFYAMLATFPALGAVVTVYALFSDPVAMQHHIQSMAGLLPPDVLSIFSEQLTSVLEQEQQSLGLGLVVSLVFAIWSAHRGVNALVYAIGVVYKQRESRSFIHFNLLTYALTAGAVILMVSALFLTIITPTVINELPLGPVATTGSQVSGKLIMLVMTMVSFALLYRYGPARRPATWRWLSPGAILSTVLWLVGSFAFTIYVASFSTYNETYGALGAIIILLMWFFLTGFSIILGAVLNAELEHQTVKDTTIGPDRPLGSRDAVVADTVGKDFDGERPQIPLNR